MDVVRSRFDSELQKVSEQVREERGLKERLFREKDALNAEKFAVEQKFKDLQVDLDLQTDKVRRLDEDILEMTSSRPGSDQESTTLRRQKQDLERRVQEQEEELDEQAATIQQLEAVRCQTLSLLRNDARLVFVIAGETAARDGLGEHAQEARAGAGGEGVGGGGNEERVAEETQVARGAAGGGIQREADDTASQTRVGAQAERAAGRGAGRQHRCARFLFVFCMYMYM